MRTYLAVLMLIVGGPCFANSSLVQSMTEQQMIRAGRESFLNRCSGCHGVNADGQGDAAPMLNPKPRNLVEGSFKLRSTPSGTLPTVEDLLRTINQGIHGTSMPGFPLVPESEKLSIVTYIRSLRPEFRETLSEQRSIPLPHPPDEIFSEKASLIEAASRGKATYQQACLLCHGVGGRGDGPSAESLRDDYDRPIRPADLTRIYLKSGPTAQDVYKAISTGLSGSPMPSYSFYSEAQRWDLVAFIFYLRGKAHHVYGESDTLSGPPLALPTYDDEEEMEEENQ